MKIYNNKNISISAIVAFSLVGICALTFFWLIRPQVFGDTVSIDNVNIIIPNSCTLNGTNTQHTANINNGTYQSDIGLSTIKAYCNDTDGFSIYAIGYTNEEDGNTVLTSGTTNISTGTSISGNNSQWAMKLATNSGATYPLTLGSDTNGSYSNYHVVPSTYTKVAYRNSGTDIGQSAIGATMTSTYQVYISPTQVAGAYAGKVKYLLIHPVSINSVSTNALTANFVIPSGSNMSFEGGATTNTVKYRQVCTNPNDSSTCKFMATEGEYKQPTNYKGAWSVPLPDGTVIYPISTGEQWTEGLDNMGGSNYLGATLTITAYNGDAILYDGNGATLGSMDMVATRFNIMVNNVIEAPYSSTTAILLAPNFKKDGYGFAGWSTNSNATPGGASTIYGPNQTVNKSSFTFNQNGVATLYAVWVQSAGTMQNFSCSSLASGAVTALTDSRDNNTYAVAKLPDGNCWMMENLRLDSSANLNSSNTNNPAISSLATSSDDWCTTVNAACVDQSELNTNNINIGGSNSAGLPLLPATWYMGGDAEIDSRVYWYGYGNYYNWYSATAGRGTYDMDSGSATGDICPSGWSLPTGGDNGQFKDLDIVMGGTGDYQTTVQAANRWRDYPKNFVLFGWWEGLYAINRGGYGNYWSSTVSSDHEDSYVMSIYTASGSNIVSPKSHVGYRNQGHSIRCLAQ